MDRPQSSWEAIERSPQTTPNPSLHHSTPVSKTPSVPAWAALFIVQIDPPDKPPGTGTGHLFAACRTRDSAENDDINFCLDRRTFASLDFRPTARALHEERGNAFFGNALGSSEAKRFPEPDGMRMCV